MQTTNSINGAYEREEARIRPSYWRLVAEGEPFRLMFPIGAIFGVIGVLLWPLFVWKWMESYPAIPHARIMIEGFFTAYIIGFIGTALPRLLGAPRFTIWETGTFAALTMGIVWAQLTGHTFWGDILFFCCLGLLIGTLGLRFCFRRDVPPPGFVLVALGFLSGLTGSGMLIVSSIAPSALPYWLVGTGKLLLYQGYILLPVLGIGAFLLPRFFSLPNRHDFPESMRCPAGWAQRALWCLFMGALIWLSFVLEALSYLSVAYGLRGGVMALYFITELPLHKAAYNRSTLSWGLRLALISPVVGYLLVAIWPAYRLSFLHVVYITGFGLLTFTVATRVVLGHSGQSHRFKKWSWLFFSIVALALVAMLTRVTADWMPRIMLSHYAYAAIFWIFVAILWLVLCWRGLSRADEE